MPWVKFFPRRWLGDPSIRDLSFELRGVLLELHAVAWPTRRLPHDAAKLARRLGINRRPMERYLSALRAFYDEVETEVTIELRPLDAFDPKDAPKDG